MKSLWNLRQEQYQNLQWRKSNCRTNTSTTRKKQIQKSRTVRITVWDPITKVKHLSKFLWDYKNYNWVPRSINSTRIGRLVLLMDVTVSKDKHICRWADRENLIYVRWNRIKNCAQRWRRWSIEEKEVRQWVKSFKNIKKNLHSFLEISFAKEEVLASHKLRDHA